MLGELGQLEIWYSQPMPAKPRNSKKVGHKAAAKKTVAKKKISKKRVRVKKNVAPTHVWPPLDSSSIAEAVKGIPTALMKEWQNDMPRPSFQKKTYQPDEFSEDSIIPQKEGHTHRPNHQPHIPMYHTSPHRKLWLWTAVFICVSAIFALWILNIDTLVYEWKGKPSQDLLEQTKTQDLKSLFQVFEEHEQAKQEKDSQDQKNKVNQILRDTLSALVATTTPSSTPTVVSTTHP